MEMESHHYILFFIFMSIPKTLGERNLVSQQFEPPPAPLSPNWERQL